MLQIKLFELSVGGVVQRFYTMVAGTLVLGFLNHLMLATLWAMIFAVSSILGVKVYLKDQQVVKKGEGKIVPVDTRKAAQRRA